MSGIFTPEELASLAERPHGTQHRYSAGCRCVPCRAAHARYRSLCYRRQRAGVSDPLVSAGPVIEHLRSLSAVGVGYRSVTAVTGVHQTTLQKVKSGQHKFIKKSSAEKILAVSAEAVADHGRIDASTTRRLIELLLRDGFTYRELAKRAGVGRSTLSHRKPCVTARTRMKIEKFYNRINVGEENAA